MRGVAAFTLGTIALLAIGASAVVGYRLVSAPTVDRVAACLGFVAGMMFVVLATRPIVQRSWIAPVAERRFPWLVAAGVGVTPILELLPAVWTLAVLSALSGMFIGGFVYLIGVYRARVTGAGPMNDIEYPGQGTNLNS
jgi:hypothetical protein